MGLDKHRSFSSGVSFLVAFFALLLSTTTIYFLLRVWKKWRLFNKTVRPSFYIFVFQKANAPRTKNLKVAPKYGKSFTTVKERTRVIQKIVNLSLF